MKKETKEIDLDSLTLRQLSALMYKVSGIRAGELSFSEDLYYKTSFDVLCCHKTNGNYFDSFHVDLRDCGDYDDYSYRLSKAKEKAYKEIITFYTKEK